MGFNSEFKGLMSIIPWITHCDQFDVYGSVNHKYIPIYIQQDATLHSFQI